MKLFGKILGGLLLLVLIAAFGLFTWFWWKPVGVNNYINKTTAEIFLLDGPELLTSIGMIENTPFDFHSGKLSDYTKSKADATLEKVKKARAELNKYGPDGLDGQELISWKIMATLLDDIIRQGAFEYSNYPVNQISGPTVNLPSFLTDTHRITNEKSVKRYISRLNEFGRVLAEARVSVMDHRDNGVVPPDFIIEKTLAGMRSFINGGVDENPLITTLVKKLDEMPDLENETKANLIAQAKQAVSNKVIPGYEAMITLFEDLRGSTNHDAGIWRIPDGDKIYAAALKSNTTTDFTPDEVHEIGLSEVARISTQMDIILRGEGLEEGTVSQRVQTLMRDPQHIFENTPEGRQEMLDYLVSLNEEVMSIAGEYFITLPPQALEIVRVPEYSQDSAPSGYYRQPALDGSTPGRFYINLKDTADNPRWTLPTLLYHEAAPGHHFQISSALLIKGVPFVRKFGLFTAYTEGWALYAERVAKEDMGLYADDPLGDLGRLQAEMFRAVRLVVDTGMHAKRWSREQAIDYMISNTGMTDAEVTREIERYVVWPGQATSYKTGQLAILRMRRQAEKELGDKFNLRAFHEMVLLNGAMPLNLLQDNVDAWIAEQRAV